MAYDYDYNYENYDEEAEVKEGFYRLWERIAKLIENR